MPKFFLVRICFAPVIAVCSLSCTAQTIAMARDPLATPVSPATTRDLSGGKAEGASQLALGPADVIHITVWKNTDLSQSVTIGPDGFISIPLVGDLHVAGMTADQLGRTLTAKLSTYIVTPQVNVSMVEIHSRQVYILGQVSKPGGYPLIAPLSVLQLIAQAGGLSTYANRKGIFILRAQDQTTTRISFNYSDVLHGNGTRNISLLPGDTVVVP